MKSLLSKLQTARPWSKGKLIGQKAPLTAQKIWSIRMHLQDEGRERELALLCVICTPIEKFITTLVCIIRISTKVWVLGLTIAASGLSSQC